MKFSILFDRLRWEEKEIMRSLSQRNVDSELLDIKTLSFNLNKKDESEIADSVLIRCLSHYRSWLSAKILESRGKIVFNKSEVIELCMNKLLTTLALVDKGIKTPETYVSFSSESASQVKEKLGLPVVIKPVVGSWGRLISLARDSSSFRSIIELREAMSNPIDHIYYIQEFVKRPPRDIRAVVAGDELVACVYRYSPPGEWKTNVARGGLSVQVKVDEELHDIIMSSAEAVGGGILGVDIMESEHGYLVHEVNSNVEFKGAQSAVSFNIAERIADYLIKEVKK
jgi:[lysine-biosynthesis-protein LysW]--L-2-aminoadipate ligase